MSRSFLMLPARLAACVAALCAAPVGAGVVTLGPNPQALPGCPTPGLPGLCVVEGAAQVLNGGGDFAKVRIGRTVGDSSLRIADGNSLSLTRLNLATEPAPIAASPDLVVGDSPGIAAHLAVQSNGRLSITVPDAGNGSGGLFVGFFAAPSGSTGPSTTVSITDGGQVTVSKPGGASGFAAAVGVGYGAGSNSSLLLDGGINGFGNQANRARLDTTGNLSIGREGTGAVNVFRNADLTANVVFMSTLGLQGQSSLSVGVGATLSAAAVYAGIGLGPGGYDAANPQHGTAVIATRDSGWLQAPVVLGRGGTLMGTGSVGPSVLNLGGTVKPGFSPGTLHIDGSYTDVGGHIQIEIGPNGSDFIDVAGDLSLHGTSIEFRFIDGFAPDAGFSYDFIDADGSVDLADLQFSFSGLQPGFQFSVSQPGPDGVLTFVARTAGIPLPEPALPALMAAAALAAAAARRLASTRRTRPHWAT